MLGGLFGCRKNMLFYGSKVLFGIDPNKVPHLLKLLNCMLLRFIEIKERLFYFLELMSVLDDLRYHSGYLHESTKNG